MDGFPELLEEGEAAEVALFPRRAMTGGARPLDRRLFPRSRASGSFQQQPEVGVPGWHGLGRDDVGAGRGRAVL